MGRSTPAQQNKPKATHIQGVRVSRAGVRWVKYNRRWHRFDESPFNSAHLAHYTRNLPENRRFPYDRIISKNVAHTRVYVQWTNGERTWEPSANFPREKVQRAPLYPGRDVGNEQKKHSLSSTGPGQKSTSHRSGGLGEAVHATQHALTPRRCHVPPRRSPVPLRLRPVPLRRRPVMPKQLTNSPESVAPYNTPHKKTINEAFATSVRGLAADARDPTRACIYLDAQGANTTQALAYANVPLTCYCVNFNRKTVDGWIFPRELAVTPICSTFQEAVQHVGRNEKRKLAAVFADFCCTFEGTSAVRPKEDLEIVFRYLDTDAVVAFTFSLRDRRLKMPHADQILSIRRWVQSTAGSSGYSCRFKFQLTYFPSMYFALVHLRTRRA